MRRAWLLGLTFFLAGLLAGCVSLGSSSETKQPPTGTYGDLAVTVYRDGATALTSWWQRLFLKAYAEDVEERTIKTVAWEPETYTLVSKETDAIDSVVPVSMRVPARFGYRLAAVEYVMDDSLPIEITVPRITHWGLRYPVDVDANQSVATSVYLSSLHSEAPMVTHEVTVPAAEYGSRIEGVLTIETELTFGGLSFWTTTPDMYCDYAARNGGESYTNGSSKTIVNWTLNVPYFDHVDEIQCEFLVLIQFMEHRPMGGPGREYEPWPVLVYPEEPPYIRATLVAPGGYIGN